MIFLLSGLLVIHGVVCLLGAFFPFYPPVYLFYVFFPGHFAIRLIIVFLIGAVQIVYGMYLALGKRWRIRWYWPAIATVVITGLLLVYPAVQNPGLFGVSAGKDVIRQPISFEEMLPVPGEEAADDILPAPGMGPAYRANVHQQGVENSWPSINTTKVTITSSFEADTVYVRYRDYIETKAGESRNNVISISMGNRAVGSLNLYTINLLAGIEVTEGMRWHGPGPVAPVLVIEISPDVQPGQYNFGIGIEIDDKMYGVIPCTIEVLPDTVVPQALSLEIASPLDKAELDTNLVKITGTVSDPTANVTANYGDTQSEAEVAGDGSFYAYVDLAKGSNTVEVIAMRHGEKIVKVITLTFNPPPAVYMIHPYSTADTSVDYTREPITVTGHVNYPEAKVTVNGVEARACSH